MKKDKLADAQSLIERDQARKRKVAAKRAVRETVKALRTMADMLEAGEVSEWSVNTNFGHRPMMMEGMATRLVQTGADTLTIEFRHSQADFRKRLRRRERRSE